MRFHGIHFTGLLEWCRQKKKMMDKINDSLRNLKGYMPNFVVNTEPADGLAPFGARPSAGAAMTKSIACIYVLDCICVE